MQEQREEQDNWEVRTLSLLPLGFFSVFWCFYLTFNFGLYSQLTSNIVTVSGEE